MKIYIVADMEGIGGIVRPEQVLKGNPEYDEARRLLIREVNAVVEGALAGGATHVVVKDAHADGFNFPPEELHPAAEYIMGTPHPGRFPDLDETVNGVFLVGYHAMAGTPAAVRDHTYSSRDWQAFYLNDRQMGEVGIDASIAGYYGVPVLLVTGDDKVCAEARGLLGEIVTAQVKTGIARHCARLLPPARVRDLVREKARAAMELIGQVPPLRHGVPVSVKIRYTGTEIADGIRACWKDGASDAGGEAKTARVKTAGVDGVEILRLDGQTVLYEGNDLLDVLHQAL